MSAYDLVRHIAEIHGLPRREAINRASDVLWQVGLGEERLRPVGTFSTGQRQRVKLAQAIAHDPMLVLLDEPTDGLDPTQREAMLALIRRIGTEFGIDVVLSSHLLEEVERICDQVVILARRRGRGLRVARRAAGRRARCGHRAGRRRRRCRQPPARPGSGVEVRRHGNRLDVTSVALPEAVLFDAIRDALADSQGSLRSLLPRRRQPRGRLPALRLGSGTGPGRQRVTAAAPGPYRQRPGRRRPRSSTAATAATRDRASGPPAPVGPSTWPACSGRSACGAGSGTRSCRCSWGSSRTSRPPCSSASPRWCPIRSLDEVVLPLRRVLRLRHGGDPAVRGLRRARGVMCTDRRPACSASTWPRRSTRDTYLAMKAAAVTSVITVVTLGPPVLLLVGYSMLDLGPGWPGDGLVLALRIVVAALAVAVWFTGLAMVAELADPAPRGRLRRRSCWRRSSPPRSSAVSSRAPACRPGCDWATSTTCPSRSCAASTASPATHPELRTRAARRRYFARRHRRHAALIVPDPLPAPDGDEVTATRRPRSPSRRRWSSSACRSGSATSSPSPTCRFARRPGVTALLGPNGAGKSTLLRVHVRADPAVAGHGARARPRPAGRRRR